MLLPSTIFRVNLFDALQTVDFYLCRAIYSENQVNVEFSTSLFILSRSERGIIA